MYFGVRTSTRRFACAAQASTGCKSPTELILSVNEYNYPVSVTNCRSNAVSARTPPFVLLSAAGQRLGDCDWLKHHLSQYADVISIGHCVTPHPSNSQNSIPFYKQRMKGFETEIDSIKHTMNYLQVPKANFVGISFGGILSYLFAKQYPSLVQSMVLNSVGAYFSDSGVQTILAGVQSHDNRDVKTAAKLTAETFCNDNKSQRIFAKHFQSIYRSETYFHQFRLHAERTLNYFGIEAPLEVDESNAMVDPNVRTLVVCAESDHLFSFKSAMGLAATLGNRRIHTVDGNHFWMMEKDKQPVFCDVLSQFFE
eukprot:167479_1